MSKTVIWYDDGSNTGRDITKLLRDWRVPYNRADGLVGNRQVRRYICKTNNLPQLILAKFRRMKGVQIK